LNGLVVAFAGGIIALALVFRGRGFASAKQRIAFGLGAPFVVGLLAAATFVGVNPFLYPNPLARTIAMANLRSFELARNQARPEWGLPDLSRWIAVVPQRVLGDYLIIPISLLNVVLVAAGLYGLARRAWAWQAGKQGAPPESLALWAFLFVTALPALFTPVDWDRYYLFPVIFNMLCIGVGLEEMLRAVIQELGQPSEEYHWYS
jgi:hypothetical protein